MQSYKCLRSYTLDREVAFIALKKILRFKVDQFVQNYAHDSEKAFNYLQALMKQVIEKGDV